MNPYAGSEVVPLDFERAVGGPRGPVSVTAIMALSDGWPVLLGAGVLLGFISGGAGRRPGHFLWFLPVLLLAAIVYVLVTGAAESVLILAPERLGIGVLALAPAVSLSFVAAWGLQRLRAAPWLLMVVPVVVCVMSAPLAGFLARHAVCELASECL